MSFVIIAVIICDRKSDQLCSCRDWNLKTQKKAKEISLLTQNTTHIVIIKV